MNQIFAYLFMPAIDFVHVFRNFRENISNFGSLGDFLGGTIFGLITVILVYMTYNSQKKELELTSKALNEQSQIMQKQNFENTFFKMVDYYQDSIKNCHTQKKAYSGETYYDVYGSFQFLSHFQDSYRKFLSAALDIEYYKTLYEKIPGADSDGLNIYRQLQTIINNLINIINFLHDNEVENIDLYKQILISKISADVVFFLIHELTFNTYFVNPKANLLINDLFNLHASNDTFSAFFLGYITEQINEKNRPKLKKI